MNARTLLSAWTTPMLLVATMLTACGGVALRGRSIHPEPVTLAHRMTMPPRHGAPGDDRDRAAARRAAASSNGGAVTGSALVDHARAHGAERRGGGVGIEPLATESAASLRKEGLDGDARIDLLTLDEGLDRPRERSERASRIVELRFCGGLTEPEIAQVMGITRSTETLEWKPARAWLSAWMNCGTAERPTKDQEPT